MHYIHTCYLIRCSFYCDMFRFSRTIFRQYTRTFDFTKIIIPTTDPLYVCVYVCKTNVTTHTCRLRFTARNIFWYSFLLGVD
jgi:hypothetical protein